MTDTSLREKAEHLKRKALKKFHNDHLDGDLAIHDLADELLRIIDEEVRKGREAEIKLMKRNSGTISAAYLHMEYRLKELQAPQEGGDNAKA